MSRTWIHDLADDLGISGAKDQLTAFAQAVNNPATGEALYELYEGAMRHPSRGIWTWDDLTSEERHAWGVVAEDHRKYTPQSQPIDMILYCPACGTQHIDAPDSDTSTHPDGRETRWTNPPHRSHLCASCGHIWRPADVPTNGVSTIATRGKDDSEPMVSKSWKPIETAPKDGTHVLLGRFPEEDTGVMHVGLCAVDWWRQHKDAAGFTGWGKFNATYWPPTHWMPLPHAPR